MKSWFRWLLLVCKVYQIKCKAINSSSLLLRVTPERVKNSMRSNKKENFEILFESMRGIWNEVMLRCIWSNRRAAPQSTDILRFWIKEASCLAHDFAAFMHLILIYLVLHGLWDILSNCLLHFNKNFQQECINFQYCVYEYSKQTLVLFCSVSWRERQQPVSEHIWSKRARWANLVTTFSEETRQQINSKEICPGYPQDCVVCRENQKWQLENSRNV